MLLLEDVPDMKLLPIARHAKPAQKRPRPRSIRLRRNPIRIAAFLILVFVLVYCSGLDKSFSTNKTIGINQCNRVRAEVFALVDGTRPSLKLNHTSPGRLNLTGWVGANGLSDECWTYQDRYTRYKAMPPGYNMHNHCNGVFNQQRANKTAFVLRVGEVQKWNPDLILFVRALVSEVAWKQGMDLYILQHLNTSISSVKAMHSVPAEFRPFTKQFTMSEIIVDYDPSIIKPIPKPPLQISVMAQYNHMAETYFMRRNLQYDFAWFSEIDVRLTGRWDTLFNNIESTINRTLPRNKTVDLISFTPSYRADRTWIWANSMLKFPLSELTMSLLQLHRVSRALINKMHDHHVAGNNAYFEGFIPSVATMSNLTKFIYSNPVFADVNPAVTGKPFTGIAMCEVKSGRLHGKNLYIGNLEKPLPGKPLTLYHGATYSPLNIFSGRYYRQWRENPNTCRPVALVHPVK